MTRNSLNSSFHGYLSEKIRRAKANYILRVVRAAHQQRQIEIMQIHPSGTVPRKIKNGNNKSIAASS
jgi:hypothetical protein